MSTVAFTWSESDQVQAGFQLRSTKVRGAKPVGETSDPVTLLTVHPPAPGRASGRCSTH